MKTLLQFLLFSTIVFNVTFAQTTLIATGSTWKYHDLGQDLGTSWIAPSYNDSGWSSGASELGYGDGDEQTVVSYGSDSDNKYPTTYFRKAFYVSNPSQYQQILGSVRRDDGVIVYVNGIEVFRNNLPSGTIGYTTLASSTVAFSDEDDYLNFAFSPALLINGNNVVAVSLHQDELSSSDISFNMSLTGSVSSVSAQLTREPYLNSATPSSVIVKWQTDVPCDSKVWFGTSPSNLNLIQNGYSHTTEHEITVSGLLASTTYYYKIGYTGNVLSDANPNQYFKTSPETGALGTYRFWAIGDAGMSNGNQRDVRDGFLAYSGNSHIDGWILLGDNAYGNGINDGTQTCYQTAFFDEMYGALISRTVCWPATGNHDYNNHIPFSPPPAYFDIFSLPTNGEAGGVPSSTEKYYSYDYGNIHFIVLDSYDEDRSPNSTMTQWLIQDLQQNTQDWTIAYWHHPPYTKGSHNSDNTNLLDGECEEMRENILPVLEQYGVDLVLNGHSHCYERTHLLDSHYGTSSTLVQSMILDDGTGGLNGECPYRKETKYNKSHKGTIYAVVGCSGKLSSVSSSWPHPAMNQYNDQQLGSMLVTVENNKLTAEFIGTLGEVVDQFSIVKNAGKVDSMDACVGEFVTLVPSFPGLAHWMPIDEMSDSITVQVNFSTMYVATDASGCVVDTFFVDPDFSPNCVAGMNDQTSSNPEVYITLWHEPGMLPIGWHGFTSGQVRIEIVSMLGQHVLDKTVDNKLKSNCYLLNPEQLDSGMYIIRISDKEHSAITKFYR